jgi:hypothetical protein
MKYKSYMNVIYETHIRVNQTEPPYTFGFMAKIILSEKSQKDEKIYMCWKWMRNRIEETNVSPQKVDDLFGERIKEILVNKKLKEIEKDFI